MGESNEVLDTPAAKSPAGSRPLVLIFRVFLLVLAAGALTVAIFVHESRERAESNAKYVCPMHPEVRAAVPGVCPICRMELEPIRLEGSGPTSAAIKASTYHTYDTLRWRGYGPDTRAPAWVEDDGTVTAVLYHDELASRLPEEGAVFTPSSAPGTPVEVRATLEAPYPWDRSTSHVHFRADAEAHPLHPGEVGWLRLATRPRGPPVIPYSAILEGADGPYVLVASADARVLTKRPVEIGRVFGGVAAVLSGLHSSERVLIRSAFFVDAERRLRRQTAIEMTP